MHSSTPQPLPSPAPHRSAPALRLENVSLVYPDCVDENGAPRTIRALDAVDLSAEPGTVTALVGPSGSGKSSLLAVASTLIGPSSGSMRLAGRELTGLPEKDRAMLRRTQIGTIFQQPNLLP